MVKPMYKNIFTKIFLHAIYYYYGEGDAHTDVQCSATFVQVQIPGYFVVNLIKLDDADVFSGCITHHTNYIIYIYSEKTQTKCK